MIKKCQGTCPYCGSTVILYEETIPDGEMVAVIYECDDCGKRFKEWYIMEYCETNEVDDYEQD